MRFAILVILALALAMSACSRTVRPPVLPAAPNVTERLGAANGLLRVGCFDCLTDALREFETIGALEGLRPADAELATAGAIRAALLLDVRQRELGTTDDGYLQRAKDLVGVREDLRTAFAPHFVTADSIPWRLTRFNIPTGDEALRRMQELRANYQTLVAERQAQADQEPLSAYAWLAFYCAHSSSREDRSPQALLAPLQQQRDAPIVEFRIATCIGIEPARLTDLLERQPRFVEITYFLGQVAIGRLQLDQAERMFTIAYKWRERWPALTSSLGNLYFTFEEPARALDFYDQTLAMAPDHPEALIGRVKALSVVGRHDDAFALIDRILSGPTSVFPGEAFYWRAWNYAQLGRFEEAWIAIEQAEKLWVNSEVAKLGGIIAYRRSDLPVARLRFEAARKLSPDDCEVRFYLGNVHADQRDWPLTASAFTSTAGCLERGREGLRKEIADIAASEWPEDRKARQIAGREEKIATAGRMLAVSWFNTAAAHYNLGNRDDARSFAERVVDDEQFSERAKEILKRLQ